MVPNKSVPKSKRAHLCLKIGQQTFPHCNSITSLDTTLSIMVDMNHIIMCYPIENFGLHAKHLHVNGLLKCINANIKKKPQRSVHLYKYC